MTAPLPSSALSPIAGFVNALARLTIRCLNKQICELETARRDALELREVLRAARHYKPSDAAGYIDRTGPDG